MKPQARPVPFEVETFWTMYACWMEEGAPCPLLVASLRPSGEPDTCFTHFKESDQREVEFLEFLRDVYFPQFRVVRYILAQVVDLRKVGPANASMEAVLIHVVGKTGQRESWVSWINRSRTVTSLDDPEPWLPETAGLGLVLELLAGPISEQLQG